MRRAFNKQYVVASYDPKFDKWTQARDAGQPYAAHLVNGIEEARRVSATFADVFRSLGGEVTGSYKTEYAVIMPPEIHRRIRIEAYPTI